MKRLHALSPVTDERYPLSEAFQTLARQALELDQKVPQLEQQLESMRRQVLALQQAPARRPLLTKAEAAEYLRVSVRTIYQLTAEGELPVLRLPGGHPRYRADDLDAWIASRVSHD